MRVYRARVRVQGFHSQTLGQKPALVLVGMGKWPSASGQWGVVSIRYNGIM